jgi:hypothetical protein
MSQDYRRLWDQYQAFVRYADLMHPKWEEMGTPRLTQMFGEYAELMLELVQQRFDEQTRMRLPR